MGKALFFKNGFQPTDQQWLRLMQGQEMIRQSRQHILQEMVNKLLKMNGSVEIKFAEIVARERFAQQMKGSMELIPGGKDA